MMLEQHLRKVLQHLVNRTTTEVRQLFRRLWEEWRGDTSWDDEFGRDLWTKCCTQLKTIRKELIITGQIDKWNIQELTTLFSAVTQVTLPFSCIDEVILKENIVACLHQVVSLFGTFDTTKDQVSEEQYCTFISKLEELLPPLDTYDIKLSSITRELISVQDLKQVMNALDSLKDTDNRQPGYLTGLIQRCTDLLKTSNLPPHLEELVYKYRLQFRVDCEKAKKSKDPLPFNLESDCIQILKHDRTHIQSHYYLSKIYSAPVGKNVYQHLYHYMNISQPNEYPRGILRFIFALHPFHPRSPSFIELSNAYLILRNENPSSIDFPLAMKHLTQASKLGNSFGDYVRSVAVIMQCEQMGMAGALDAGLTYKVISKAIKTLQQEVSKEHFYFKYSNKYSQVISDQLGYANFLLGYMYETGLLVERDYNKAKKFYRSACINHNNVIAGYHLGLMYYDGAGVPKNPHWAQWYWKQSIMANCEGTSYAIIMFYLKHLEVWKAQTHAGALEPEPGSEGYKQMMWLKARIESCCAGNLPDLLFNLDQSLYAQWEQPFGLSLKGLTLLERMKRAELLGFEHDGNLFLKIYSFFNIPYHQSEIEGLGFVKHEYVLGVDTSLEVEYSQLFSRVYLVSPLRVFTVTSFRHQMKTDQRKNAFKIKYLTEKNASLVSQFQNLLIDIDRLELMEDFPGELTVIEDLLYGKDGVHLVTEDGEGTVTHVKLERGVVLYRVRKDLKLEFGAKILLSDTMSCLTYEDFERHFYVSVRSGCQVIVTGKVKDMCRFCGNGNAGLKCKCGKTYCGQSCMEKDSKFMKHKLICA